MGQINRFHIFCFNLYSIFVLKPRMSCNYELSRLFPFSLSLLIPFRVGLLKTARLQLETSSLGIFEIIFHKNTGKMSEPIRIALLFGFVPRNFSIPLPCGGLWFVLFSSSRVKNMNFEKKRLNISTAPQSLYFPDFSLSTGFQLFFDCLA